MRTSRSVISRFEFNIYTLGLNNNLSCEVFYLLDLSLISLSNINVDIMYLISHRNTNIDIIYLDLTFVSI